MTRSAPGPRQSSFSADDVFELLCAASHDGVFDLDLRTGALRWSDRHYRQLGLSPSNFAPDHMAFMERVHPDDRDALERKVSAHVAAGTPYATQFRIRHHAGHYLSVETRAKVAYSEEREAVRFVGTMRILEESDEIRRELETTRKLFDSMAQHAPGVVFRYSWSPGKGEKLEYVSQGCRDLLEISASEVERDPDRVWSMVDDECLEQMRKSIKESARSLSVWDQVWCLTVPSGVKKWIHGRGTPELRDDGTVQWHAMCLDITERVAAEQQARESRELRVQLERLESLSQLSGGIAHDFNNLLAVVGVNLEMLEDGRRPEAHPTMIATALKAVERGGELTRRLLSFSKKAKLEPVHLPLGEWIRALHDKVRSQVRDCVDVDVEVDEPLPSIRVDRSALEHAVLNVVRNADESMPEGGALKIAARAGAESVEIVVSDSGVGMSEAVRRRALEPFFSTKPVGRGTGLGLATVHGFVVQSGGELVLESAPDHGTRVVMKFPAVRAAVSPSSSNACPGGRVLVVEDEPSLRCAFARQIAETGLEVETAEDGDHALDRLKSGRFDLLLSDVQMPGRVLGDALARTALSQGYVQAAILLSGNPDSNSLKEAERSDRLRLLLKPLRREALVSHVQEMLAAHCSAPRSSTPS